MSRMGCDLVLIAALAATLESGCESPCANDLVSVHNSPDGEMKAVVFVRACGATTAVVTGLSILPAKEAVPPRGWANALFLSDDPEHPTQRSSEAIDLRVEWISTKRLRVSYPRGAIADKRSANVNGISIEYTPF